MSTRVQTGIGQSGRIARVGDPVPGMSWGLKAGGMRSAGPNSPLRGPDCHPFVLCMNSSAWRGSVPKREWLRLTQSARERWWIWPGHRLVRCLGFRVALDTI